MSRGLGKTQRRLIDILNEDEDRALSVKELARRADISERQCLTACKALEKRDLVGMTKAGGGLIPDENARPFMAWPGQLPDIYRRWKPEHVPEKLYSLSKGDPLPWKPGWTAPGDVDVYPGFVPGGWWWMVWPEKHVKRLKDEEARWANVRVMMRGYA